MAQTTETRMREETIDGGKGASLFLRSWRPAAGARAVVVVVHGFNSHSGYYKWAAERLLDAGVATYALDLRGRGKSGGERLFVESFDDYVDDVATVVALAKSREQGLPVFLLGHSAGGVVGCLYALERPSDLAGLICESFAFKVPAPDFALAVLKGLSHVAPHAHTVRLNNADFSRDPKVVDAMNADPLIANEAQPLQTMAAIVRADQRLERDFGRIRLPLLILHGTSDKAAKPSGSQAFYDAAGSSEKTLKLYEGGYHDLLNDLGKEKVMKDIQDWLAARLTH